MGIVKMMPTLGRDDPEGSEDVSLLRNKDELMARLAAANFDSGCDPETGRISPVVHRPKDVLGSREEWELLAQAAPAADQGWGKYLHRALNTPYLLASDPSEAHGLGLPNRKDGRSGSTGTHSGGLAKRHYFGPDSMFICAVWYERRKCWLLVKAEQAGRVAKSWATWGDGTVPEYAAVEYVRYPYGTGVAGDQLGLLDEVVQASWEWAADLRTQLELEDEGWGDAPALTSDTLEWLDMRTELGFGRIAKADSSEDAM